MADNYQNLWDNIKLYLSKELDEATYEDILADVCEVDKEQNGTIYVVVPDVYKKNRINNFFIEKINNLIKNYTTENLKFKFVLKESYKKRLLHFHEEIDYMLII